MVAAARIGGPGLKQLEALSVALKNQANKGVKQELGKAFRRATRKPINDARGNARNRLPREGGLAERVASSKISTRNRLTARHPSVTVIASNQYSITAIDAGQVRHPVHGNTTNWVTQAVPPGWWSDAWKASGPQARKEVALALREVSRKLARSV